MPAGRGRFLLAFAVLFALPIAATGQATAPIINEYVTLHADLGSGQNANEFIEIFGDADTNYTTYSILVIDGDRGSQGVIDNVFNVGTTNADGYWSTPLTPATDDIAEGTLTILLVQNFTGAQGDDLDTTDMNGFAKDGSGFFDATPWDNGSATNNALSLTAGIIDSIAISDGGKIDRSYVPRTTPGVGLVLGPGFDGIYVVNNKPARPHGASRIADASIAGDVNQISAWKRNSFAGDGFTGGGTISSREAFNTLDAINSAVTPPTLADASFTIAEDAANAAVVGTVTAVSTGPNSTTFTYTILTGGNTGGEFSITTVSNAGEIRVVNPPGLDFESSPTLFLTIVTQDEIGQTASATVTISVTNVNEAPVANNDAFTVAEDSGVTALNVILDNGNGIDTDPENDTLVLTLVGATDNGGTVSISGNKINYEPALNFFGDETFTYTLSDGALTDTATVTVTVTAVNDAPVARNDTFTVLEDSGVTTFNVLVDNGLGADSDVENDPLTVIAVSTPNNGGSAILNGNNVNYQPAADFSGTETFSYTLFDGALTNTASVSVTVTEVNDAPVANDQTVTAVEDIELQITLTGDDGDANSTQTLTFILESLPATGTLSQTSGGQAIGGTPITLDDATIFFTTAPEDVNQQTFDFSVTDDGGTDDSGDDTSDANGTVTVNITPINDAPVANDDFVTVDEGGALSTGPTSPTLVHLFEFNNNANVAEDSVGAATLNSQGGVVGNGSYTFLASQGLILKVPPTLAENYSIGLQFSFQTITGFSRVIDFNNLVPPNNGFYIQTGLLNFFQGFGIGGTIIQENEVIDLVVTRSSAGAFTAYLNGSSTPAFTFTDNTGQATAKLTSGPGSVAEFIFFIDDGSENSAGEVFEIRVWDGPLSAGDIPGAFAAIANNVLDNDQDADLPNDTLTVTLVNGSGPSHHDGAFTLNADGTFQYQHDGSETVTDSFDYLLTDLGNATATATVFITINPVNDAPVATAQTVSTDEDTPLPITLAGTDVDSSPLTFAVVDDPTNGALSGTEPNLTYTPGPDFNGTDSFTFRANDGLLDSVSDATVTITVNAVNDDPTLDDPADEVINEDAGMQMVTLMGISPGGGPDEAAQALTVTAVSDNTALIPNPNVNFVQMADTAALDYTPVTDQNGTATITVTVSEDGSSLTATQEFTVTVNAVNDAPTFDNDGDVTVDEDSGAATFNAWASNIIEGPQDEIDEPQTPLMFDVTVTNNPGLFSDLPAIDATSGNLTFTPADEANGFADITVELKDSGGGDDTSAPVMFTITVNALNDAPVAAIIDPDSGVTIVGRTPTLNFSISDVEGDMVSHRVEIATDSGFTAVVLSFTSALGATGDDTFTVGQALVGGDNYNTGDANTRLVDGTQYFWRVRGADADPGVYDTTVPSGADATFTIDVPVLSVSSAADTAASETDSDTGTFTVTLNTASNEDITANLDVGGTASTVVNEDYDLSGTGLTWGGGNSLTVLFLAGETTHTITLTPDDDAVVEALNETAILTTANGTGYTHAPASATVNIEDDDSATVSIGDAVSVDEMDAGTTTLDFTVTLNGEVDTSVTVDFTTMDGSAVAGSDFTGKTDSVTFPANSGASPTMTVSITVLDDSIVEATENLFVDLTAVSPTTGVRDVTLLADTQGEGTITDDDMAELNIASTSVSESGGNMVFSVTLTGNTDAGFTVVFNTNASGTATAIDDYTPVVNGTLTFAGNMVGDETQTINVPVIADNIVESDETFDGIISAPTSTGSGGVPMIGTGTETGTILDDDTATLTVTSVSQVETNGNTNFDFIVTLSAEVESGVTVDIDTADISGGALAGTDYMATSVNDLVFVGNAGEVETFTVVVTGDQIVEADEVFDVLLSDVMAETTIPFTTNDGTGTIEDDDQATISINDVSQDENAVGTLDFTVTLNGVVDTMVTVTYTTTDDTAEDTSDYTSNSGTVTFPADGGMQTKTISITISGDSTVELNETFFVDLSNISPADTPRDVVFSGGGGEEQGVGAIDNDDSALLTLDNPSVNEDSGPLIFTATLSNPVDVSISVPVITTGGVDPGDATGDDDYVELSGTDRVVTFGANTTSAMFNVTINMDSTAEPTETFDVNFGAITASGRDVTDVTGPPDGVGTIINDDAGIAITADQSAVQSEGDGGGTTAFTFTVTRTGPTTATSSATYTVTGAGNGPASDDDFSGGSFPTGTVNFGVGDTVETITILVNADAVVELNEDFRVTLGNASAGTEIIPGSDSDIGTILNDDSADLTINNVTMNEGDSGTTDFTFDVILSESVDAQVTIDFDTSPNTATSDDDFISQTGGQLTFDANGPVPQTRTITVAVNGDVLVERDETFFLDLSGLVNNGRDVTNTINRGTGTITNDDLAEVSIAATNQAAEPSSNGLFTVTTTKLSDIPLVVNIDVTGTATSNTDYTALPAFVTIPAGMTTVTIDVLVIDDNIVEIGETVIVTLDSTDDPAVTIAAGTDDTATVTITDDDSATISIDNVSQAEGSGDFVFTVTLSDVVDTDVMVNFATIDGSVRPATAGVDYTANSNIITFQAGGVGQTQIITIVVVDDNIVEDPDETFFVNLSGIQASNRNVGFSDSQGLGTIENDDAGLTITSDQPSNAQDEGTSGGNTAFTFTVTRTGDTSGTTDVNYAVTGGATGNPATADDFSGGFPSGTVNFGLNDITMTISIDVIGDTTVELNETFTVTLSNPVPSNGTEILNGGTVTDEITNDDFATLSIQNNGASGNEDNGPITFTAELSNPVDVDVTFDVSTSDGTASITTDNDYGALTGVGQTISANMLITTFTVTPTPDAKVEANETFGLLFSNLLADSRSVTELLAGVDGTGIIDNDDNATLTVSNVSQVETNADTTFEFSVTLSAEVQGGVDVNIATADLIPAEAVAGSDYEANNDTLMFDGGVDEIETFTVTVNGDDIDELDEDFAVQLGTVTAIGATNPVAITTNDGTGTIEDDDEATISIDSPSADENTGNLVFTVTLAGRTDAGFTVDFVSADVTAENASDYDAVNSTLNFDGDPGETQTISVPMTPDLVLERNETLTVTISNPSGSGGVPTIVTGVGIGTITNDDTATLSIGNVSLAEGDFGTTDFVFTVTLNGDVDASVTVDFATANGSATTGDSDYVANSGSVGGGGELNLNGDTAMFTVVVNGDTKLESDEDFFVNLSNILASSRNVTFTTDGQATGTITNDDFAPVANPDAFTVLEDSTTNLDVLGNTNPGPADSDADGDSLTVTDADTPTSSGGATSVNNLGNINNDVSYTPLADFNSDDSTDTFTYFISDGNEGTASALVTVTITPVNDVPSFTKGPDQTEDEDSGPHTVAGWATSLSAGPDNESGQTLSFNVTGNTDSSLFSAGPAISATGELTYSLALNAFGSSTITVTIKDNGGTANSGVEESAGQTFTITVTAVNDAPEITGQVALSTPEDTALAITLGDLTIIDVDNNPPTGFTLTVLTGTNYTLNGNTITPVLDFNGVLTVPVTVNDGAANGALDSPSFDLIVTVTPENDPPVANDLTVTISENDGIGFAVGTVSVTDVDDNMFIFTITAPVPSTNFAIDMNSGDITVNTASLPPGPTTVVLTVNVSDGALSDDATITINITEFNDPPTILDDIDDFTVLEDAVDTVINLLSPQVFTDEETAVADLTYTVEIISNGSLFTGVSIDNSTDMLTIDYAPNAFGFADITVRATDDGDPNKSVEDTFRVTVSAVNDAPTISAIKDQFAFTDTQTTSHKPGVPTDPISFTVNDDENLASNLNVSVLVTSGANVIASTVLGGSGSNRTIVITPIDGIVSFPQNATVQITVLDDDSVPLSASTSFDVEIRPLPLFPVIRNLPDFYVPGVAFQVLIEVKPRTPSLPSLPQPDTTFYIVHDVLSESWDISNASDMGMIFPTEMRVSFGGFNPDIDNLDGELTYFINVPSGSTQQLTFTGLVILQKESFQFFIEREIDAVTTESYADWRLRVFGPIDGATSVSDVGADFSADGIDNGMDYALGFDPTVNNSANPGLAAASTFDNNGVSTARLVYQRSPTTTAVTYTILDGSNPGIPLDPQPVQRSVTASDGVNLTVTVEVPVANLPGGAPMQLQLTGP